MSKICMPQFSCCSIKTSWVHLNFFPFPPLLFNSSGNFFCLFFLDTSRIWAVLNLPLHTLTHPLPGPLYYSMKNYPASTLAPYLVNFPTPLTQSCLLKDNQTKGPPGSDSFIGFNILLRIELNILILPIFSPWMLWTLPHFSYSSHHCLFALSIHYRP